VSYEWHGHWIGFSGIDRWLALLIFLTFYFLPSIVAATRGAKHGLAIGTLNLLFGWTVAGWIVALIWALAVTRNDGRIPCPFCAERIMAAARVCPHCQREIATEASSSP
jgi:hypothetical protein